MSQNRRTIVGITVDNRDNTAASGRFESPIAYSCCVAAAGGVALLLPHDLAAVPDMLALCDAFIFTGGADPVTEPFGEATHAAARRMDPQRQAFETALLRALAADAPDKPVLGICLGMQLMALIAGGSLHQHLPDVLDPALAAQHLNDTPHPLAVLAASPLLPEPAVAGTHVTSHHHQAVADAGRLRVLATGPGDVIEAIDDPARRFYAGVQWHPERTAAAAVGQKLIDALVRAAGPWS